MTGFRKGRNKKELPIDEIVNLYNSGSSVLSLSKTFGVSRDTIHKRLAERNVKQRNQSEASLLRMSKLTDEEKAKITDKANKTVRGVKLSSSVHQKRALTLQNNPYEHYIGYGELEFKNRLDGGSIEYVWQKAVEIYSLDFMIMGVAVELRCNAKDRGYIGRAKGRIARLKELGINTVYVCFQDVKSLMLSFDDILTAVNEASKNNDPSFYHVFSCEWRIKDVYRNKKGQYKSNSIDPVLLKRNHLIRV